MARVTCKIRVSGKVQGVSYRLTLRQRAMHGRVDGWVKNSQDGSVEAILQGEAEDVRRLLEWAERGPPGARIDKFEAEVVESYPEVYGFQIHL